MTLKKRLFSSPAAFLRTLTEHEKSLRGKRKGRCERGAALDAALKRDLRVDEDYADDEEDEATEARPSETATRSSSDRRDEEWAAHARCKDWAAQESARVDAKAKELIAWLERDASPGGEWTDERVIIFTEYRATQNWLQDVLAAEGFTAQTG